MTAVFAAHRGCSASVPTKAVRPAATRSGCSQRARWPISAGSSWAAVGQTHRDHLCDTSPHAIKVLFRIAGSGVTTVEQVVLLDEAGQPIGAAPKDEVHHRDTPLHLAFSCYVVDAAGQRLDV